MFGDIPFELILSRRAQIHVEGVQKGSKWGNFVISKVIIELLIDNNDFRYMKFIYLYCGEETNLRDPHS